MQGPGFFAKKIQLNTAEGKYFFSPAEILRLEASSNYTSIYFTDTSKMLLAKVLKEFECTLCPLGFIRTHRSHLVNQQYITHISSDGFITMKDNSVAGISRRKKPQVMRLLRNKTINQ